MSDEQPGATDDGTLSIQHQPNIAPQSPAVPVIVPPPSGTNVQGSVIPQAPSGVGVNQPVSPAVPATPQTAQPALGTPIINSQPRYQQVVSPTQPAIPNSPVPVTFQTEYQQPVNPIETPQIPQPNLSPNPSPSQPAVAPTEPTSVAQTQYGQPVDPYAPVILKPADQANRLSAQYQKAIDQAIPQRNVYPSANQNLGVQPQPNQVDQNPPTTKGLGKRVGVVVAIAIVLIGGALLFKSSLLSNSYQTYKLSNGGNSYTFKFFKNASTINSEGLKEFKALDPSSKNTVIVSAYGAPVNESCSKEYSFISVDFQVTIQGKPYNVCSDSKNNTLFLNFEHNQTWSQMILYSNDGSSTLSNSSAKTIMDSVTVD
jgi:hypothetical protein